MMAQHDQDQATATTMTSPSTFRRLSVGEWRRWAVKRRAEAAQEQDPDEKQDLERSARLFEWMADLREKQARHRAASTTLLVSLHDPHSP